MTEQTFVYLGPEGERFCHAPPHGVTLLGTIQEGLAIGALAQRADGRYVQLNGDFERDLDAAMVERLLARQGWRQSTAESGTGAGAPVVTIKRRRVPVMPTR